MIGFLSSYFVKTLPRDIFFELQLGLFSVIRVTFKIELFSGDDDFGYNVMLV